MDVAGVSFLDAIESFFPSPARQTIGSSLIRNWGFDLKIMHSDKLERNNSSYQLKELMDIKTTRAGDLRFIKSFWTAFEPGSFELERYLIRSMLEGQAMESTGSPSLTGRDTEYGRIDSRIQMYVSQGFLERVEDSDDHDIISAASIKTTPAPITAMLGRASILLRIATGMVEKNFQVAMVKPIEDLEFWWSEYGIERGFWSPHFPLDTMAELWGDILQALDEAEKIKEEDRYTWLSTVPHGIPRVCEAERIALWTWCR